MELKYKEVI